MSPTIAEARTQLESQKQLVSQKKQEIAQAQQKLQQARARLPPYTQRSLRQGLYAGLKGRQARRVVEGIKGQITGQEQLLEGYKGQIGTAEGELGSYEAQIKQVEQQVQQAEEQKQAYETAKKFYEDRVSPYWLESGLIKDYLEQFWENERMADKSFSDYIAKFQAENPTEKLVVDWNNMRVLGVSSGALQQSMPAEEYNKRVEELNKQLSGITSNKELIDISKNLDRTAKTQDIPKLEGFSSSVFPSVTGFGVVSAQPISFLTTGSPIEYANLNITGGLNQNATTSLLSGGSSGDNRGVISSLWSGVTNLLGGGSTFEKGRETFFQKTTESYNPNIKAFVSASPSGLSSTAYLRPPSPFERQKIEEAQFRGSYGQLPPIKFLSGGYEWQKQTLKGTPIVDTSQQYRAYVSQTPFSQLNLPQKTLKGFQEVGKRFVGAGLYWGEKAGVPQIKTATAEQKQQFVETAGGIVGEVGLWAGFSPLMSSGTYAQAELESSVYERIYDYTKGKWVLKNKLTGQIVDITPEEIVTSIKGDLLQRQAGEDQLKYLSDVYKKFFKDKLQGTENFRKLVQDLYASGEFKGIPLDYFTKKEVTSTPLFEIKMQLPYIRGVGKTGSVVSNLQQQMTETRFDLMGQAQSPFSLSNQKNKFSPISTLWTGQVQQTKQEQKQIQRNLLWTGTGQVSELKSQQKGKLGLVTLSGLGSLYGLRQPQQQAYRQIQRPQPPRPSRPPRPRPPKERWFWPKKSKLKLPIGKRRRELPFVTKTRRYGKWFEIGRTKSFEQAFGLGKRSVASTLGASFKVERKGQAVQPRALDFWLRKSKREPSVIVQRKERIGSYAGRLSSQPERREIQLSRLKKKSSFWR